MSVNVILSTDQGQGQITEGRFNQKSHLGHVIGSAAESESDLESESESAGVGSFNRSRSRSRLQHFFIIPFLVKMETKMETEHYVLTADRHNGLPCTVRSYQLSLRLRLFPGELAFNHTSRPDNQNRQRHSIWGLCSCLALSDKFWRGNRLKKIIETQ